MLNRRTFMTSIPLAACASLPLSRAIAATGSGFSPDSRMVINSLGGLSDGYGKSSKRSAGDDFIPATAAEIDQAIASGMVATNTTLTAGGDYEEALALVRKYDAFIAAHPTRLMKVLSAADILKARREGKLGLIFGFQNSAMMGDDVSRVDRFADMGVRVIQLTYNDLNQLGAGSLVPTNDGLTAFGREVVERLNERRVMIDLSHSGQRICLDAARASTRPISITHTGCAAVAPNPRSKTDEELRLVAEKGGYIGIYFMPFLAPGRPFSSEDVVTHIDHAINICGEDHIGIGTDHAATELGPIEQVKTNYARIVNERRAKGISAPGEDPAILPYGTDLMGPDQFRVLAATMEKRGYSANRIEKVLGLNFLNFTREIWG